MSKIIKAGVIGLGVGEQHVISYNATANCVVKAVCDLNQEHAHNVAKKHNVAHVYDTWEKIAEDTEIDVISICSYDNFHAEQVIAALKKGKHVMVEKPVVLHPKEAEKIIGELERSKKFLTSNLILRQSPRFKEIKRMANAGEFGEIFHIEGDYLHDILWKITEGWRGKMEFYCTVYGGGIHLIDLMRWIMGKEITHVAAMGTDILTRASSYKYTDTITALLQFENGATGKTTTCLGPKRSKFHSLNIYGTEKTFVNDMPYGKLFSGDKTEEESTMEVPYPAVNKGDLIPEFIENIRTNTEPLIGTKDIFRVMAVCFAIGEALQNGRKTAVTNLL
jgi:predicted dehydrogenase